MAKLIKGMFYLQQVEVLTNVDEYAWGCLCLGLYRESGSGIPLEYYRMVSENGDQHFLAKDIVLRITLKKKPKKPKLKLA